METNKYGQKFYKQEADAAYPDGCQCGNNGGGDCDWCEVYYGRNLHCKQCDDHGFVTNAIGEVQICPLCQL